MATMVVHPQSPRLLRRQRRRQQRRRQHTSMPLDVTLSIRDVCFRLVAAKQLQQEQEQHSPPPLAMDGGVGSSTDDELHDSTILPCSSPQPPSVPPSPITRHIIGRVRAMKYDIESRRQLLQQQGGGLDDFTVTAGAAGSSGGSGGGIRRHSSASQHQNYRSPVSFFSPSCDDDNHVDDDETTDDDQDLNVISNSMMDNNEGGNVGDYYSVNLRCFTGTLRVYSRSQSPRDFNQMQTSSAIANPNALANATATTRSKATTARTMSATDRDISTLKDGCKDEDEEDDNIEVVLEQNKGFRTSDKEINVDATAELSDELESSSSRRPRSVRFSLPPSKEEGNNDENVLRVSEKYDEDVLPPSPPVTQTSSSSSPSLAPPCSTTGISPQPPKKARMSFLHSPPLFSYASPPRNPAAKAKNIARETSTLLARSSKHVLRQVTLAGKDAYDALNVEDRIGITSSCP